MKKHLKKISVMTVSLLVAGTAAAFAGCDKTPDTPDHTHTYTDTVVPPTCTERGYTLHECECGAHYSDSWVNKADHTKGNPVKENEIPSTCETEGSYDEVVYCAECKTELSRNQVITDLHNFVDGVCSGCGATRDESSGLTASGYDIDYSTSPATVSRTVPSNMHSISLGLAFTVKKGYSWKLYGDADGKNEIANKQLTLSTGHNNAYILVDDENGENVGKFLLDIYRLNSYQYSFVNNGNVVLNGNADENSRQYPPVNPTKEFYDFAYWAVNGVRAEFPYVMNSDVTFDAVFTPTEYEINYVLNGGSFAGDYPAVYTIESSFALVNPVKENYGFAGWYDNPEFNGEPVTAITRGNHGAVTYYAKWSASTFTIEYNLDGGEFKTEYVKNFTVETPDFELAAPVKTDHAFLGWFTDPEFKNAISKVEKGTSGNLTLYARWLFGTDGLALTLSEDGSHYAVSGYTGTAQLVEIPADCYGVPVTEIGAGAFKNNAAITGVTIPAGITAIGDEAFAGCSALNASLPETLETIGKSAFEGCSSLTEITLPEGLKFIGGNAFKDCSALGAVVWNATDCKLEAAVFGGCTSLTEITISENLTAIPDYAFGGCSALPEFTIHGNIEKIGSYAFSGCTSLTAITVPDSVTEIGLGAFNGCGLESISVPFVGNDDGNVNCHFGYIFGAAAAANNSRFVPASLKSVKVTGGSLIGLNAFSGCASIETVELPETVESIGNNAFLACTSLKGIKIPASVTTVSNNAFQNCTAFTSAEIPDGVTSLGMNAFFGCTRLASIKLGTGVTAINSAAFQNCSALNEVTILGAVTQIGNDAFRGCTSLKEITLPDELASIGDNAFNGCTALEGIIIPNEVKTLGMNVFNGCSKLVNVTIGTGVSAIPSSAFTGCTSLQRITIPDNVTTLGGLAFSGCSALTDITLSENLTQIGSNAFYQCYKLNNVTIPDGVKSIGGNAFRDCRTFTEIEVPLSVTSIGAGAFNGCSKLEKLTIPFVGTAAGSKNNNNFGYVFGTNNFANNPKFVPETLKTVIISGGETIAASAFFGCANIVNVTLPDSLTTIGDEAFRGCAALAEIELTENITEIGNSAFISCTGLAKVIWNATDTTAAESGETPIFADCAGITELEIGENVTAIPAYAFRSCNNLETVTIGASVKTIGAEAFYDCESIENLLLPEGLTSIGSYAFYNCNALSEIVIHGEVTEIGANAFDGCLQMAALTIGGAVETIGAYAFQNCAALTEITVPDSVTAIGSSAFRGCIALERLTIPFVGESVAAAASAKTLFGFIFGTTNYTGSYVAKQYYASNGYTNYYIPTSLTTLTVTGGNILFGTFDACNKLKNVTLPAELTDVGAQAFRSCSALSEISIPVTVKTIGNSAFSGCSAMGTLTFEEPDPDAEDEPATLGINAYAFQNCSSLTDVFVPDRTTAIANNVFMGCNKLVNMDLPFIGNNRTQTNANNANVFGYIFGTTNYTGSAATPQTGASAATYYIPSTLRTVNIRSGNVLKGAFQNCKMLTGVTLPDTLATQSALGDYSFQNCTGLTSLIIPENVTSIGQYAFNGCAGLLKISVPAPVTTLNVNAFQNCTNLAEVEFAENNALVTISNHAFNGCSKLARVDFGSGAVNETSGAESPLTIGTHAFSNCAALSYTADDDGFTVPARVTTIGANAFQSCTSLVKLYFGGSRLSSIGNLAFNACTKLEEIDFGVSETSFTIGSQAFDGCTALARTDADGFEIPARVTTIGTYGFRNTGIAKLSIGKNSKLTAIGDYAFYGLTKLTEIDFGSYDDAEATVPNLTLGVQAFLGCNNAGFTTLNIPVRVTTVGTNAFQDCTGLVNLNIADGSKLTSLGNYAFYNCTKLENVDFGDTETKLTIGTYVFQYCYALTEIVVPDHVAAIGLGAFMGCKALTTMTLPFIGNKIASATTNSNAYVFGYIFGTTSNNSIPAVAQCYYNTSSTSFYIPRSIKSVTITGGNVLQGAFDNCNFIESITLPNPEVSTTTTSNILGAYAFRNCTALETIKLAGVGTAAPYNIPENITSIGNYAFDGCSNASFTDIAFPADLATIGQYAFRGCTSLVGDGATGITIPEKVTAISAYAFQNCTSLTTVNLHDAVAKIDNYAFAGCELLDNVKIPESVTTIGNYAFSGCENLNNVNIPLSVTSIGEYCFQNCTALDSISFEEPAEGAATAFNLNIAQWAFQNCVFESITLPDRTNTIANNVFSGCSTLKSMDLPFVGYSRTATGANAIFGYVFGTASYAGATATNQWSNSNYYIPDSLVTVTVRGGNILQNAFLRCRKIRTLILPERLYSNTVIGDSALRECDSLTTLKILGDTSSAPLTLPANTTAITANAFLTTPALAAVNIPETVTTIGQSAFQNCTALTRVTFAGESKLTSFGNYAFAGCENLNGVAIPATVTSIGQYCFQNCSSLKNVSFDEPSEGAAAANLTVNAYAFQYCTALTSITLPDRTNAIANLAFMGCGSITTMNLPFIGNNRTQTAANNANVFGYIFGNAKPTETLGEGEESRFTATSQTGTSAVTHYVPSGLKTVIIRGGNILQGAFDNCKMLTSITLPETVYTSTVGIGAYAFRNCEGITGITLPSNVPSVGNYAFQNCVNLASISIPETVTTIGQYAFQNCTSLGGVSFEGESKLTALNNYAFADCTALTAFTITEKVTAVGTNVFQGCENLASITVYSKSFTVGNNSFDGCTALTDVYCKDLEENLTITIGATGNEALNSAEWHYEAPPAPEPEPEPGEVTE